MSEALALTMLHSISIVCIKLCLIWRWLITLLLMPFKMMMDVKPSIHIVFIYVSEEEKKKYESRIQHMTDRSIQYLNAYKINLRLIDTSIAPFEVHSVGANVLFKKECLINEQIALQLQKRYSDKKLLTIFVAGKIPSLQDVGYTVGGYMGFSNYMLLSTEGNSLTLAHEIGHAQGLLHVKDPSNLMCSGVNRRGELLKDGQLLLLRYGLFSTMK